MKIRPSVNTMLKPLVSVVIPVYNSELYIKKCLNSVLAQSFTDYEIIIINDGSNDNILKIIKEYQKKYSQILCFSFIKNKGVAAARNEGIIKSSGKYIMFVDSDDYINKNMLRDMLKIAERDKADIVCSIKQNYILKDKQEMIDFYILGDTKIKNYILLPPEPTKKIFRKELMLKDKFPLGIDFEDLALIPALIIHTNKISFIDSCYYNYVQREGSITNQKENIFKREDIFKAVEILFNKFKDKGLVETYYQELEYIYVKQILLEMCKFYLTIDITSKAFKDKISFLKDIINTKFPNWTENEYYNSSKRKYRILGWLIDNNCFVGLNLWKSKYLKKG